MTEYRITKYNPANRVDGIYVVDEWTSFSDVGKKIGSTVLTDEEYLKTERAYIDCCMELIEWAQIPSLSIVQAEYYGEGFRFPLLISKAEEIRQVITACLREQCWLKLIGKNFFIHFGYDYNMYIGTVLPSETVEGVALKHRLYCELHPSPYN